jgi:leader peptidase (prepilin peptidase) / N-methyltransferase
MAPTPISIAQVFATAIVVACLMDLYIMQALLNTASRSEQELRTNVGGFARWPLIVWLAGSKTSAFVQTRTLLFPIVELVFGLLATVRFLEAGDRLFFAHDILFLLIAIPLGLYSLLEGEGRIAPDELTLGGTAAGLLTSFMRLGAGLIPIGHKIGPIPTFDAIVNAILDSFLGALLSYGALRFVAWSYERIRHREGLGLGAVKTGAFVGAFLGLQGSLLAMLVASLLGAILGLSYTWLTGKDAATYPLSFVFFQVAGGALVILLQPSILQWYR